MLRATGHSSSMLVPLNGRKEVTRKPNQDGIRICICVFCCVVDDVLIVLYDIVLDGWGKIEERGDVRWWSGRVDAVCGDDTGVGLYVMY